MQSTGTNHEDDDEDEDLISSSTDDTFWKVFSWLQVGMIILYAFTCTYGEGADPKKPDTGDLDSLYGMFQNVHVMVFVGFALLMAFLRKYGYGAMAFTLLIGSWAIEWGVICLGYMHNAFVGDWSRVPVSAGTLIDADFAAVAALISYGAVIGKASPTQIILMIGIELILYAVNIQIGLDLNVVDIGGTMYIHTFGAYFGLAVSKVLCSSHIPGSHRHSRNNSAVYHSDIFSILGTAFLWLNWPSFVAAFATGSARDRAVINTYFALVSSSIFAFIASQALRKRNKFDMVDLQNATLAGGVAIGAVGNFNIDLWGALLIGGLAGIVSVLGYVYVMHFLEESLGICDTCGVHNLHGMPGVLGAIASVVGAAVASRNEYGDGLAAVFPKIDDGSRSAGEQGAFQLYGLLITLGIAVVGGAATGFLMTCLPFPKEEFTDKVYFAVPDDFYRDDLSIPQEAWAEGYDEVRLKRRPSVGHRGVQIYEQTPRVQRKPRRAGGGNVEEPTEGGDV